MNEIITMKTTSMKPLSIHLSALFASVLWASAFLGGKYALVYLYPLRLAAYRLFIACFILLFYIRKNPFVGLAKQYRAILKLSLFQTIIVFIAFNQGLNLVPGSFGAVIIGSSPAISSLVAVLFLPEERLSVRKALGLAIGLTGIALLTLTDEPWKGPDSRHFIGAALLLLCNFSTAYGSIIIKKQIRGVSMLSVNFVQMLFGGIVIYVLSLLFEPLHQANFTFPLAGSLFFLAFISATAISLWLRIVSDVNTRISVISLWKFLIPSLGAILSWLFIADDHPSPIMIIGIITIGVSIALTVSTPMSRASIISENHMRKRNKHDMLVHTGEQQI